MKALVYDAYGGLGASRGHAAPRAASAPSRSSTANPAARRSTPRRTPATPNSSGRWAPTRSLTTQPRISATRFRISTSSRSAATFACARRARSNPAACGLPQCRARSRQPPAGRHSHFDAAGRLRTRGNEAYRGAARGRRGAADGRRNVRAGPRHRSVRAKRAAFAARLSSASNETRPAVPQDAPAQCGTGVVLASAGSSRRSRVE